MTAQRRVRAMLVDLFKVGTLVYIVTFIVVTGRPMITNHYLEKKSFEDFVIYHDDAWDDSVDPPILVSMPQVFPPQLRVFYDSQARYVSNLEVVYVPPGGFVMSWDETLFCDNNPHDGYTGGNYMEPEASVATTSQRYMKPRPRKTLQELRAAKGWPVRLKREGNHDEHLQTPIVRYPKHDADCPIKSTVTIKFPSGHEKSITIWSQATQVRGLIGDAYAP